jgi:hypothetical protein
MTMDSYSNYTPKKVSEQRMKAQAGKGDGSDVFMDSPQPTGAAKNPAASPDGMFGREFSAEKDLATLISAAKIRRDKARFGKALELRDRMAAVRVNKDRGAEPLNERGPDNHTTARSGSPARRGNSYDNVKNASKPNNGTKMDGQRGRW